MTERPTPYDLIFAAPGFDESRFERVREQDSGAKTPTELFMLSAAGGLLRELLPDEEATSHSAVVAQVSALMFHAYRFWLLDRRVCRLDEDALAPLLTGAAPPADWEFAVPAAAGYVQLPRHALWARVEEDAVPEPVDGFFWSAPAAAPGEPPSRLDLLLALGVRAGRPGVSLIDVAMETTAGIEEWSRAQARPGGTDFENVLPGGELQDYHALTTHAEAVKLAVLCFWQLDTAHG